MNTSHLVHMQEELSMITAHPLFTDILNAAPLEIGDANDRLRGIRTRTDTVLRDSIVAWLATSVC